MEKNISKTEKWEEEEVQKANWTYTDNAPVSPRQMNGRGSDNLSTHNIHQRHQ